MHRRGLLVVAVAALLVVVHEPAARADDGPRPPTSGVVDAGPSTDWTLQPQKTHGANEPPVWVFTPTAPPAPAPSPPPKRFPSQTNREEASDSAKLANVGGLELSLGALTFVQSLRSVRFNGEGVPVVGPAQRVQFHHQGRELGLDTPSFWGGELQIHYLRRYFAVGGAVQMIGHPGGTDAEAQPAHNAYASQVAVSSLTGFGAGFDVAGALPLSEYVTIRPGMFVGARWYSMPLAGYEKRTCTAKGGRTYPCDEIASTDALFAADARVTIHLTPSPKSGIFLGGFVGMSVMDGAMSYGLVLGIGGGHADLMP